MQILFDDSVMAPLYAEHVATLQSRAATALERGGFDHLIIPSGVLRYQVFDDRNYYFAVNPNFKYWLPIVTAPESWIVITPGQKPKLIFMQPHDYWHSVPQDPGGYWVDQWEIHIIRNAEEAQRHLPHDIARCAILGEDNSALGDYKPNNPTAVLDYLDFHRAGKTAYELNLMREAQCVGVAGHRAAEQAFRDGRSEFEIHMSYCMAAQLDANQLPYQNIIALNEHGAVLHYGDLDRRAPNESRSFLIDAGGSYSGYASDITRTYSRKDDDFAALVAAVNDAQLALCDQVRVGADYKQIHLNTHLAMSEILRAFGLIKCSPEAALAQRISNAFFPHGVGHPIGLQVHDVAGFSAGDRGGRIERPQGQPYLRLTRELVENMVVTIEPGIYFVPMLLDEVRAGRHADSVNWERVAAFLPFGGIRIEDNVVAGRDGPVNLTREAFAS